MVVSKSVPESAWLPMSVDVLHATNYLALVRLAAAFLCNRQSAEDVVQDVFTQIETRRPRLDDPDSANRYLRVSVLNGARNALRAQGRRSARDSAANDAQTEADIVASAEVSAVGRLHRQSVRAAVMTLPDRQRDVVFLRYRADLSIADTARTLNISEGAVKASNTRALKALARILGDSDDD